MIIDHNRSGSTSFQVLLTRPSSSEISLRPHRPWRKENVSFGS
jgi:hypothetical protein